MKNNFLKKVNKFVCCLVILSLFLQFIPSTKPVQAFGISDVASWLKNLVKKASLPDIVLTEQGDFKLAGFTLFPCVGGKDANEKCNNPFSQIKLKLNGKEVKSQISLATSTGELTIPNPYLPEVCELSIPLPGDDNCQSGLDCERKKLAKNTACIYLNRLQDAAAQEVYLAYKIFNSTDPFSDCLFVKNCRTNCSLRLGEVKFSVSLLDVAALFVPGGFLTVIQKILNIAKIINEAFKIYTVIKETLSSGLDFLSDLFNVMGQVSSMFKSFTDLGLKWSDVLIYGGGALTSNYLGKEIQDIGVGKGGNIGWLVEKGGDALSAGDGLLGGVAATALLNSDRAKQATNAMQDMLANFAQNNLKFSTAKTEALKTNEKIRNDVEMMRSSFKAEPEIAFLFNPNDPKKAVLNNILDNVQLAFRSVDEFLNDIRGAVTLKDGRVVNKITLGGGLGEWQSRVTEIGGFRTDELRFHCSRDAVQLPLGGGLAPNPSGSFNCYVPNMVTPNNGVDGCKWFNILKSFAEATVVTDLKNFFELTDPDYIRKAIVGCDDLSCFEPGGCPGGPIVKDCQLSCYGTSGACKLTYEQDSWREYWEHLAVALYGQEKWDELWNEMIKDGLNMSDRFLETKTYVNKALGFGPIINPLSAMQEDINGTYRPLWDKDRGWDWTRGSINTRVPEFFKLIGQQTITQRFFLEKKLNDISAYANNLFSCVDNLNNVELGNKFWSDLWWTSQSLLSDTEIENKITSEGYEGEAAFEDWDERIKVIQADMPKFEDVKKAISLGVSPESPIVVYKIAQAEAFLEDIKKVANQIGDNQTWDEIANKIIDLIIYGTPTASHPNAICSIASCPPSPVTHQPDCLMSIVLRDYCEGGIYQTLIYPNEKDYKNYTNCCVDESPWQTGNSCCGLGTMCNAGTRADYDKYVALCDTCLSSTCSCTSCATQDRYSCSGPGGSCAIDANGSFTTSNCNDTCVAAPQCGNGIVEGTEQCDDGNTIITDSCVRCRNARCGDRYRWSGVEECDDGNTRNGDGCSSTCMNEEASTVYVCFLTRCEERPADAGYPDTFPDIQSCIDSGCEGAPPPVDTKYSCSGWPRYVCESYYFSNETRETCEAHCKDPNRIIRRCRDLSYIDPSYAWPWCSCEESPNYQTDQQCFSSAACRRTYSECKPLETGSNIDPKTAPVAVNIFDNLKQKISAVAKNLFAIPKALAAILSYCYPNCNGNCFAQQTTCQSTCQTNTCNGTNQPCALRDFYKDKYQCFENHELIYRNGYNAYNEGLAQIKYFNDNRGKFSAAIIGTADALNAMAKNLKDAFNAMQKNWGAPFPETSPENQESQTASSTIDKIITLKADSKGIVKIAPNIENQLNVLTGPNGLLSIIQDFIRNAGKYNISPDIKNKLNQISNDFQLIDAAGKKTGAIPALRDVIENYIYTKLGPRGIGDTYKCGQGVCLNSTTFLCALKCFETNNIKRAFEQLIPFTDVLRNIENAAFGLTQSKENIKAIEPSLDMTPVTVKPNLLDEVEQKAGCCNGSVARIAYEKLSGKNCLSLGWINSSGKETNKCSQQITVYSEQRQGEKGYEYFKSNILANPLSTLEQKFNAVSAAFYNYVVPAIQNGLGDTQNKIEGVIFNNDVFGKDTTRRNAYMATSTSVLKQARYLWWDLIWGNEDVSQELFSACTTTENILTSDPSDIASKCRNRLTEKDADGKLIHAYLLKEYNPTGYDVLKNQCQALTELDLDVLENLKNDPKYIDNRIKTLNSSSLGNRGCIVKESCGTCIVCPWHFCASSTNPLQWTPASEDDYCKLVQGLYKSGDKSKGAIRYDGDNQSFSPNVIWDPSWPSGQRVWPPPTQCSGSGYAQKYEGAQVACLGTQKEIESLLVMQDILTALGGADKLDYLADQCNQLSYQEDFQKDCYNFDVIRKVFGNEPISPVKDDDVKKAREAINGFCRADTEGKVITETIVPGQKIGDFFGCSLFGNNVTVDLTAGTQEAVNAREAAVKLCFQATSDMRTPLNEVMKVFSVLLGVKSYTSAKNGLGALYFDAQKVRQRAEDVINLIKEAPKKFGDLWNSEDTISKIGKANIDVSLVKCIEGPMISYAGGGKALTGPKGGQVCPNVSEQFGQLDAMFSQVRQNLRMIDLARQKPSQTFGFFESESGDTRLKLSIPKPDQIDPDLNELVQPIYDRAEAIKEKSQLLWALATAINYANTNCTCGQSYCPTFSKIPLCISGLPLTVAPLKEPFCHLIWTLRYPLGSLAKKLAEDLESETIK
ncbi:MAG: DUF4215 domain-containing protein [Candidatus Pacebacteria bacterium]|nr:DUF4215 domain-containing protein [Candidatus Paceibacterota bacterium]